MKRREFLKRMFGAVSALAMLPIVEVLPKPKQKHPEPDWFRHLNVEERDASAGFNFYDLEAPVQPLYPVNFPIRVTYKEIGIERGVTFTPVPAGKGFTEPRAWPYSFEGGNVTWRPTR